MYIEEIMLKDFRNFASLKTELHPHVNILYGQNAQGKTNLLESVYFCATGRSHRTSNDKDCIRTGQAEAMIKVTFRKQSSNTVDFRLKRNGRKGAALNQIPVHRIEELFGAVSVVMFSPEDLSLIKNGPAARRKFLDLEICQTNPVYLHDLKNYFRVLKQRNLTLKNLDPYHYDYDESLLIWDQQLVELADRIMKVRRVYVEELNRMTSEVHDQITHGKEHIRIDYHPGLKNADEMDVLLRDGAARDILLGSTSCGPHRDDLYITVNDQDVRVFGSQGQQRTAALSMKLAEMNLMEREIQTTPILLLDDVMSELDHERQLHMLQYIERAQTIITCTGVEDSLKDLGAGARFHVVSGTLEKDE